MTRNQVLLLYGSLPGEAVELIKREAHIVGPFGPQDDWRAPLKVDNIDLAAATERGICVVNTPDAPTEPVAEKTVSFHCIARSPTKRAACWASESCG